MVFDLHNDILTADAVSIEGFLKKATLINVRGALSIFRGNMNVFESLEIAERFKGMNNSDFRLAFEDVGYKENAIDCLVDYEPLYMSLTWNGENVLGFGCDIDLPLKKRGLETVSYMERRGITLDVAHLSEKGFYSVLDSGVKIINSHTAFYSVHHHKRNIKDEQILKIIERGGIIGITFVSDFLDGSRCSKTETIVRHIDNYVQKFGDFSLCIGTDFYGTKNLPEKIKDYKSISFLVEKLEKLGYNKRTIKNIMFDNANRYFNDSKQKE